MGWRTRALLDGERILQEATVDAAFTNQIGDLDSPAEIPTADPSIHTNSLPFISLDQALKLYEDFEQALYATL